MKNLNNLNCYVYTHKRLDNNKIFYVGIGKTSNFKRAYSKADRNNYWKNIVNKTKYKVSIVVSSIDWKSACKKEIELIKKYGRKDLEKGSLVNMTDGGEGNLNPNFSRRIKHSIRMRGENNSMYGKRFFKEDNPNYGKRWTKEQREHLSKVNKGRLKGEKHYLWGKNLSKETKDKISKNHNKPSGKEHYLSQYIIHLPTGIIFYSIKEASEAFNINYSTLKAKLRGQLKNTTDLLQI